MRTIVLGMKQPASPPITFSLVGVHSFQVDIMFGLKPNEEESRSHSEYAERWRKRMAEAYQLASKEDQKGQSRAKNVMTKRRTEVSYNRAAGCWFATCQREEALVNSGRTGKKKCM